MTDTVTETVIEDVVKDIEDPITLEILDIIEEMNPLAMLMDGLNDAIIGYTDECESVAVYDYYLLIQALMKNDDISEEDALDWYEYNIVRSLPYYEFAPIIIYNERAYLQGLYAETETETGTEAEQEIEAAIE